MAVGIYIPYVLLEYQNVRVDYALAVFAVARNVVYFQAQTLVYRLFAYAHLLRKCAHIAPRAAVYEYVAAYAHVALVRFLLMSQLFQRRQRVLVVDLCSHCGQRVYRRRIFAPRKVARRQTEGVCKVNAARPAAHDVYGYARNVQLLDVAVDRPQRNLVFLGNLRRGHLLARKQHHQHSNHNLVFHAAPPNIILKSS